ncbi:Xaa-Pro aminopeptidase [Tranquillimonas rosea]|uniref:Xaa-Pro aminopeptidase n=1 Tax=Tranquillimonas rosea TaxID=641238 RepID=A0A1H9QFR2_9RHOB|nr:Xaa-Pro peptidase family protein [Tranquillimonas rosea]SER59240.1 Xaa-Pro aminopeptidase [Tranquillimonas rosea]SES30957.1 Xaa-Pro aminopeptidase [Tranquillimonas rosea]
MQNALNPRILQPGDMDPHWRWDKHLPAWGHSSVDFERRVDHDRLRRYRLSRAKDALAQSGCGSLLMFDVNNIRYVSGTKIGEWERDKLCRFCLLTGDEEPYVWDFGSAAMHHKEYCDWLDPDKCLAGVTGMRGTIPPSFGLMKKYAEEIAALIRKAGMADMPVGVDYAETAMFFALQEAGLNVVDGQQVMLGAREIKNWDEIQLLTQAASMVDGVYHMIWQELRPGIRENDIVAMSNKMLYEMGSDDVEAINAIAGERCNPHPHNFTDRYFRPGDQAFFDILQSYQGYRTCYYRTFNIGRATPAQHDAYVKCREWLDASIELIKPGVTTDTVAKVWPTAESLGFPNELAAFGLQFGHGLGLALHERPIISRAVSLEHPMEIETGMVFALETYCPAADGYSAARIEEEVVVTDTGCEVISLFPAEDLPISHRY